MPVAEIKKTTAVRMLERMNPGKGIREIVNDAVERHDSPEGAAAELGVSLPTLRRWKSALGLNGEAAEARP